MNTPVSTAPAALPRRIARAVLPFTIAVAIALTLQATVARLYEVHQGSMERTLISGDILLGEKLTPRFGSFAYGDVVVFTIEAGPVPDEALIKRVVGLPGDELRIADGVLYRNDAPVFEPYVFSLSGGTEPTTAEDRWTVPDGHLFVMGDHRDSSTDSRAFGPIARADVDARILFRVMPFDGLEAP